MARAKYKVGTLVGYMDTTNSDQTIVSAVETILETKDGFAYQTNFGGTGTTIPESAILNAYREVLPRATTTRKAKTTRSTKKSKANGVDASAH